MDVLVAPLKVMDNPLISQLLLDDEDVLEKLNNSLFDIEVVEFGNHSLLVLQVPFVLINQSISLIDYISDIVKYCAVSAKIELGQLLSKVLILLLFSLQLIIHVFDLDEVSLELTNNEILICTPIQTNKYV